MKKVILNVPEDVAQELGNKLSELIKEFDIQEDNDGVLDCLLPITERVRTFEDARKVLNGRAEAGDEDAALLLADYESNADNIKTSAIVAFMKLSIITAALNEGWKPTFNENEYRYFPWFRIYQKKEDDKEGSRVVARSCNDSDAFGGVACVDAYNVSSHASMYFGSRLAFRTSELAEYAGRQFLDIWEKYIGKF